MAGRHGPLADLRVVELAGIGAAPFGAMLLADLGADVIRIDRAPTGDTNPLSKVLGRGRRSVALDLKHRAGVEVVLRLVEQADALVEGFRPGVMERLGLGPDVCLARNERLVYGRMTGWGQDGPLARQAGHDIDYIAVSGRARGDRPSRRVARPTAQPRRRLRRRRHAARVRDRQRGARGTVVGPGTGRGRGDGRRVGAPADDGLRGAEPRPLDARARDEPARRRRAVLRRLRHVRRGHDGRRVPRAGVLRRAPAGARARPPGARATTRIRLAGRTSGRR